MHSATADFIEAKAIVFKIQVAYNKFKDYLCAQLTIDGDPGRPRLFHNLVITVFLSVKPTLVCIGQNKLLTKPL